MKEKGEKRYMKRLFTLLLVVTIATAGLYFMPKILSALTPSETSEEDTELDFRYTILEDGTAKVISYSGKEKIFEIPSELYGHTVSTLSEFAFYYGVPTSEVTIPDTIVSLGANPFLRCENLTKINVSPTHPTLTVIEGALVEKTTNTIISYPRMALPVVIPEGVAAIGNFSYANCSTVTEIVIPDGVTSIGNGAFYYCTELSDITIPEGVEKIGYEAFMECLALDELVIPEGVTSIGRRAFYRCKALTSVTIPDSVTSIGSNAFLSCYALTLSVGEGSYAEQYAIENKIPYVYTEAAG